MTWRLLFSAPMARAYVEGRKTVTRRFDRRLLKAQPRDILLGKETWWTTVGLDNLSPTAIGEKCVDAGYPRPWAPIEYLADGTRRDWLEGFEGEGEPKPGKTRVSIHLPDWACRIRARIVSVREEPLQSITDEDARAEGVAPSAFGESWSVLRKDGSFYECFAEPEPDDAIAAWVHVPPRQWQSAREAFQGLWNSLHGAEIGQRWEDNPSIVRVEFAPEARS